MVSEESRRLSWVSPEDAAHIAMVRELFEEYQAGLGIDLCFQGFAAELAMLPGRYAPPRGALLLALDGEEPVGCGALRDLGEQIAELKRLYVRPAHRTQGLGRRMSVELIQQAQVLGYRTVRLDTLRRLEPAVKLYGELGFVEIPAYNFNPEDDIAYFELPLT